MKKLFKTFILNIVIVATVLMCSFSAMAITTGVDDGVVHFSSISKIGDANGDGITNILDLVRMKKYCSGIKCDIFFENADIDGQPGIAAGDLAVLKVLLITA